MTERLPINERKVWQGAKYSIERFGALRRQGFKVQMFNKPQMLNRCTKVQYIFGCPAFAKPLL